MTAQEQDKLDDLTARNEACRRQLRRWMIGHYPSGSELCKCNLCIDTRAMLEGQDDEGVRGD